MANRPIIAATLAAVLCGAGTALAQSWPSKTVHIVVPFAPGGATDVLGRLLADKLSARLGQQVVIDNKPGAGGIVGSAGVAKAAPDGHTLLMASHPGFTTAPSLFGNAGFDTLRDFAPITLLGSQSFLLNVHSSMPWKNVREFVAHAKQRPGQLHYATSGIGSPQHFAMELFKLSAGINLIPVHYKGGAPALQDVVAGQVPVMFASYVIAGPHLPSGRLRAIAGSGLTRVPQAPDIPTIDEQGYAGFDVISWFGFVAPAGTPEAVTSRMAGETHAVLGLAEVKERMTTIGFELPKLLSPAAFGDMVKAEVAKWQKVIREANIKTE